VCVLHVVTGVVWCMKVDCILCYANIMHVGRSICIT